MIYSFRIMAACLAILQTSAATAQNAWDPWLDLINFQPVASGLISERDARGHTRKTYDIQRIQEGEGSALNLDEYVVQISTLPNGWSDTEFFAHVRKNLNSFLDQKVAILRPYTSGDGTDWNTGTGAQLGTLLVFEIQITGPNDMAAVVVSKTDSLSWIFSPVTDGFSEVTSDWGTHPVAGNRLFGLRQSMGNYEFFTRGADRVYPTHVLADEDAAFKGADDLWRSLQTNLSNFVNQNGGTATALTSSVPGGNNGAQKPQWASVCQDQDVSLGC